MRDTFQSEMPMFHIQQAFSEFCGRSLRMLDSFEGITKEQCANMVSILDTVAADLRVRNRGTDFEAEANRLADRITADCNRATDYINRVR